MSFHRDKIVKFDYNPVLNAQIDYLNAVGATDSTTLRTLDFTPSDTNTIYVSKTGDDSTGTGTAADPVLTIKKAESLITAVKCNIVILDDGIYEEESLAFDTNCRNISAALGKKPTIKPLLVPSTSNYFIETIKGATVVSVNDGRINTRHSKSIPLANGNHVIVYNQKDDTTWYGDIFFVIVDKNGNIVKSETQVMTSSSIRYWDICALESGNFVIMYDWTGTDSKKFKVYSGEGSLVYEHTTGIVIGQDSCLISSVGGHSDRFVVVGWVTSSTQYMIISVTGTIIKSYTVLFSAKIDVDIYMTKGGVIPRPAGGFIVFFKISGSADNRWCVCDNSGAILNYAQILSGTDLCSGCVSGNGITFVCRNTSNQLYFIEFSLIDYSIIRNASLVTPTGDSYYLKIIRLKDLNYVLVAGYTSPTVTFLSRDWGVISTEAISSNDPVDVSYNLNTDRLLINYTNHTAPFRVYEYIKGGFLVDWWKFSSDITLNGIIFDNLEEYLYRYIYSSSGVFKIKWCNFTNIKRVDYKDVDSYPLYVVNITGSAIEILNCKISENDAGFNLTSNSVLVQYCQFYKQLLNPAVHVIGAGAGIIVNHNDFLYNYVSVKLEDNNGLEVLKNNIFYTSLLYSIQAETAVTYTNSVENAVSFNATTGAQVIRSHPHYINDGYVSLEVMDLVLKSRELGYKFESPAIRLADDLKNAGSVEFEIADGSRTWDTIYVMKPKIKKGYNPVGAIETIYKDGDVDTYRDSSTEVLKLEWDSLTESDFQKLLTLYFCSNNLVQITLDPESEPGVYGTYRLVYDKINASPKNWQFDDIGKNDFDLTFKRAYNEGL
ncbi:MAG: hypothetical protein CVV49_08815 [Spirochaetae bacterium HGW-Spirochaetae-5]|nr:MAG: hypothetical protein CVV49_08815 [Spirochaetae bacterium HGW-Spirochaetae-5]